MPKITFIGAGSTVFAKNLLGDILAYPELADCTIALHDIDAERLNTTKNVAQRLAAGRGAHPRIETHLDRCAALEGADYAISMFQIGGYRPSTVVDFEIPKKYGLRQTIGDTLGIGGIMRGLAHHPGVPRHCARHGAGVPGRVAAELCQSDGDQHLGDPEGDEDQERRACATACRARRSTWPRTSTSRSRKSTTSARASTTWRSTSNFWRRTPDGGVEDLYPRIRQVIEDGRVPEHNRVRYEMLKRLGYFVTESSEHFAEYVPWFIKRDRPDLLEQFNVPLDEYLHRCEFQIAGWEFVRKQMERPDDVTDADIQAFIDFLRSQPVTSEKMIEQAIEQVLEFDKPKKSMEYGSGIIHSIETNTPRVIYGNVLNHGLIDNLPAGCVVEVPCLVDASGVQPTRIGGLPTHLAALMRTQINVQELTVEAALTGKREAVYHAAMLDPHTAAELDLDQIWRLVDDLIEAHGDVAARVHLGRPIDPVQDDSRPDARRVIPIQVWIPRLEEARCVPETRAEDQVHRPPGIPQPQRLELRAQVRPLDLVIEAGGWIVDDWVAPTIETDDYAEVAAACGNGRVGQLALLPRIADHDRHARLDPRLHLIQAREAHDVRLHAAACRVGGIERPVAVPIVDVVVNARHSVPHPRLAWPGIDAPEAEHHGGRGRAAPDIAAIGVNHLRALRDGKQVVPVGRVSRAGEVFFGAGAVVGERQALDAGRSRTLCAEQPDLELAVRRLSSSWR